MKKFVVALESEWSGQKFTSIVSTFAKSKKQAVKQAEKIEFGDFLARQFDTRVLFCEIMTPQMEALIIQIYYDAATERLNLYFQENYPIGGYYESELYRADYRVYVISEFIKKIMPGVNLN